MKIKELAFTAIGIIAGTILYRSLVYPYVHQFIEWLK